MVFMIVCLWLILGLRRKDTKFRVSVGSFRIVSQKKKT
jgi:hypothetical protein